QTFWIGQTLEFVGCALVLFNWHPAIGVGCLIVFTVLASTLLLRFWEVDDPFKKAVMRNATLANTAIVGGLLLLLQQVKWAPQDRGSPRCRPSTRPSSAISSPSSSGRSASCRTACSRCSASRPWCAPSCRCRPRSGARTARSTAASSG